MWTIVRATPIRGFARCHIDYWLFRTSRAREAILENTLLRKRLGERIQQQPLLFMVEFSTGSAGEPTFGMASVALDHAQRLEKC